MMSFSCFGKNRNQLEKAGLDALKILEVWSGGKKIKISNEKSKDIIFVRPKILPPIFKLQHKNIKDEKTRKYF